MEDGRIGCNLQGNLYLVLGIISDVIVKRDITYFMECALRRSKTGFGESSVPVFSWADRSATGGEQNFLF